MNKTVEKEVEKIIKEYKLNCSIEEFKDKVNWDYISYSQKLSESFIKEFQDKVYWDCISIYQKLSEDFYKEFKDKININYLKTNKNIDVDIEKITTIKVIFKDSGKKEKTINNRFEILDIRG